MLALFLTCPSAACDAPPAALLRFLQQSLRSKSLQMTDYKIALLCNAYSTNSEYFTLPMGVLVETIYGNGSMRITLPGINCMASGSVTPLPMNLLDSLTVHAKMRCDPTPYRAGRGKGGGLRCFERLDLIAVP